MKRADHHHGAEKQASAENDDEEQRDDCHVAELRSCLVRAGDSSLGLESLQFRCRLLNWGQSAFGEFNEKALISSKDDHSHWLFASNAI